CASRSSYDLYYAMDYW
nr:immunoglobulin heavy chain junction region [Mus musculus]